MTPSSPPPVDGDAAVPRKSPSGGVARSRRRIRRNVAAATAASFALALGAVTFSGSPLPQTSKSSAATSSHVARSTSATPVSQTTASAPSTQTASAPVTTSTS